MLRAALVPNASRVVALLAALATLGCLDDPAVALRPDTSSLFWAVTADVKALTLPMGGTYQATATPRTVKGDALTGLDAPTWRSTDTNKVKVDQNGLITAVTPGPNTLVIARMQVGNVTRADTISVNVWFEPMPRTMASFNVDVPPGDSPTMPSGAAKFLFVTALDEHGIPIPNPAVYVESLDRETLLVMSHFQPLIFGRGIGTGKVVVTTTTYGTTLSDTLELTVTYSMAQTVKLLETSRTFDAPRVDILAGGSVTWVNESDAPVDITFDDAGAVDGGNVDSIPAGGSATRVFPAAGDYHYKSNATGAEARVVVH